MDMCKKSITTICLSILVLFGVVSQTEAQTPTAVATDSSSAVTAFQKVITVPAVNVMVPTVIEVPLSEPVHSGDQFLVLDTNTGAFIGSYVRTSVAYRETPLQVQTVPSVANAHYLVDGTRRTYTEFAAPADGVGRVRITVTATQPITTSQLSVQLAQYVALPLTVAVEYEPVNQLGTMQKIVSEKRMTGTNITFPEVTSRRFVVTFTHVQPLRIAELTFRKKDARFSQAQGIRFLAQPQHTYRIYYDADKAVSVHTTEAGNLRSDEGVVKWNEYVVHNNPEYIPADVDHDGVQDMYDNCVRTPNPDQVDIDSNGRGDACDDWDHDGRLNSLDNCINEPNQLQRDEDHDGIGDACDDTESRFTEANPWVPLVGIGMAALVLLLLFVLVAKRPIPQEKHEE